MLIMPYAHDQPDNARRMKRLKVSRTIQRSSYKPATVARAVRASGPTDTSGGLRRTPPQFTHAGVTTGPADIKSTVSTVFANLKAPVQSLHFKMVVLLALKQCAAAKGKFTPS